MMRPPPGRSGVPPVSRGTAAMSAARVVALRCGKKLGGRAVLDHHALVHDVDVARGLAHDAEIVGDHQQRQPARLDQVFQQLQDLRLRGHVERRARLVGDQQFWFAEQRHGDQHALAHAARQHDRIGTCHALRIAHANLAEHFMHARHALAPAAAPAEAPVGVFEDRAHLVADGEDRVERAHRILEHHRHGGAAQLQPLLLRHGEEVAAVIENLAAGDGGRRMRGAGP